MSVTEPVEVPIAEYNKKTAIHWVAVFLCFNCMLFLQEAGFKDDAAAVYFAVNFFWVFG